MRVFHNLSEYFSLQGFGAVQEFEYEHGTSLALAHNTDLCVSTMAIPGAENRRYFMFLAIPKGFCALRLTQGDMLKSDFFPGDEETDEDEIEKRLWKGHVLKPLLFAPSTFTSLMATRRWNKDDRCLNDNPENPLRAIQYEENMDQSQIENAICKNPTRVNVSRILSDNTVKAQLYALNQLNITPARVMRLRL